MADLMNMHVPPEKTAELHARIQTHPKYGDIESYTCPKAMRRFLLARQLNVDDAYVLWESWAAWREYQQPHLIEESHIAPQLSVSTVAIEGVDKEGRTCVLLKTRNHTPGQFPFEDMLKFTIYVLETSTARSSKVSDGYITAIWDCQGQGFRNLDAQLATQKPGIIHIMKEYYPECLQSLLIVNSNWIFKVFWRILLPFIDERTRNKVQVLGAEEELLDHFHPHELPSDFAHLAPEGTPTGTKGRGGVIADSETKSSS